MRAFTKRKQKGVFIIETALGLVAFLMMIFYWVEVSYMGFVSSLMDYTATEASRSSRTASLDDYKQEFQKILMEEQDSPGSIWFHFLDTDRFEDNIEVYYYEKVEDMACQINDSENHSYCNYTGTAEGAPLAIYRVSYPYRPVFTSLFVKPGNSLTISREVIAIQEYERDQFNG